MNRIKLHDKYFKKFISNAEIETAIDNIAKQINENYKDSQNAPIFLCVLNGSFMFATSLIQKIEFQAEISFIKLQSYEGTKSVGHVKQLIGLPGSVKGKEIIIIEDIVDSGKTIEKLSEILNDGGASQIEICTLIFKPDAYKQNIPINYAAINIKNDFIVGFGLDYNQLGRQYKDIYIIDEE